MHQFLTSTAIDGSESAGVLLDHVDVALFAATGRVAASRKQLDLVGLLFLNRHRRRRGNRARPRARRAGLLGGGACLRADRANDGRHGVPVRPPHRMALQPGYDAAALAAYAVFGAHTGLAVSGSPTVAVVTGMATGMLGGIIRDIVAREFSVLPRPKVYVTVAMAGAAAYVTATEPGAARRRRPERRSGSPRHLRRSDPLRLAPACLPLPPGSRAGAPTGIMAAR